MFGTNKIKEVAEKVKKAVIPSKKGTFQGTAVPKRGHTIYEVNKETLEYSPVEFAKQDYVVGEKQQNRRINMKPGCVYISALNEKNLRRKLGLTIKGKN